MVAFVTRGTRAEAGAGDPLDGTAGVALELVGVVLLLV